MAENKFIERLQGKGTEKSVVEIKNTATPTMFTNMPSGDSNAFNTYSDHRGNATVVANGTMNWKVDDYSNLSLSNDVHGNGEDVTTWGPVTGAGLWIDAEYTFPSTGDPNHPVAMVFNPQTKWVLKFCGDNLLSPTSDTIEFTVLITFGVSNIISKTFTVAKQANKFCKEFVIDFAESNTNIIKAQGLSTMKLQLLCGTADASANIYGGMTVLTCLQRKVEAVAISSTFANVEEVLRDGLLPNDYFNNAAYIAQVTDGDTAFAVFQRDGDEMLFVGWHQPIPDQTGNSGKFLTTDGSLMSWAQITIGDVDSLQTELSDLQDQIDDLSGRGRYLSIWNCTTGLAETNPPESPYMYQSGDYFIIGTVGATNYKPDGSSYTTGVASTTVETAEVKVDDVYLYDGTNWKLLASSQRTYTFGGIAGSPYDNTALGNALNGKVDETSTANQVYGTDNAGNQTTYDITKYLKNTATATDAISVYGTANTTWTNGINIGAGSRINSTNGIAIGVDASADVNAVGLGRDADAGVRGTAIGAYAKTSADTGIAIGCWNSTMHNAVSSAKGAYQFGVGTNNTARTLNVGWYNDSVTPSTFVNYQLLDGDTGLIPDARISTNITRNADLATVATTGDYDDLLNKPTIPAAQVNSDWDAISGVAQILNKPTIPTVNDATINVTQNGVSVGSFTLNQASGDTIALTDTTYSDFTGATAGDAGTNGLVPAPAAGDESKFLQGDGTWATVSSGPTYTAGTGIDITSNVISVTAPTLTNLATGSGSLILNGTAGYPSASYNVVIGQFATTGYNQTTYNTQTVLVGYNSRIRQGNHNVSIGANSGDNANSTINYVVLLGDSAKATGTGAIQLGKGVNSTAGTVGVGLTTDGITWTQYELLSSNGTIPEARLADTTGASQGQVLTLDSNLDATWATPTASVAWGGITGTLSDQTDLQNALDAKANTDLSNLTATGQNIGNWSSNVTNCITEIPQDINLELSSGTLTLKAGSKVYVPNGAGVFDELVLANDLTTNGWSNLTGAVVVNVDRTTAYFVGSSQIQSGATGTLGAGNVWYDTTTNKIFRSSSGSSWDIQVSFPLCMVSCSSNSIINIDQVFNGYGHMGVCRFMLPGLSGLVPNGLNADGSYKNIKFTNQSVRIYNMATTTERNFGLILDSSGNIINDENSGTNNTFVGLAQNRPATVANTNSNYWYSTDENQWYNTSGSTTANWQKAYPFFLGKINGTSTSTTYFESKSSLCALDRNETEYIAHQAMPSNQYVNLTLGASGTSYTAPADGYFVLNKTPGAANKYIQMTGASGISTTATSYNTTLWTRIFLPAKKGDTVIVYYDFTGSTNVFRFVYANGAQ